MLINTGCGIEGLRGLPPGSVDLIFCDLPSGETRASFDNPISLPDFWSVAWPCLKPTGAVVLMASSLRYAATVIASEPKWYRYDVVWEKTRGTGVLNANRMPMRAHEFLLVFYRSQPTYNPQKTAGEPYSQANNGHGVNYGAAKPTHTVNDGDRMPLSVQRFGIMPNVGTERRHPQQKPLPLLQWVVRTYTNPGETVADPCAGSGSMGVAAIGDGREFIGWDFEPKPPLATQVGLL